MVKDPQKGHVRKILVQSASHRPVRKIVTAGEHGDNKASVT